MLDRIKINNNIDGSVFSKTDDTPGTVAIFLAEKYADPFNFGIDRLKQFGAYRVSGFEYIYKPFLKLYLVKTYDTWTEMYAPSRKLLRTACSEKIDRIVLLENVYEI